jgi:hypothetical protein
VDEFVLPLAARTNAQGGLDGWQLVEHCRRPAGGAPTESERARRCRRSPFSATSRSWAFHPEHHPEHQEVEHRHRPHPVRDLGRLGLAPGRRAFASAASSSNATAGSSSGRSARSDRRINQPELRPRQSRSVRRGPELSAGCEALAQRETMKSSRRLRDQADSSCPESFGRSLP